MHKFLILEGQLVTEHKVKHNKIATINNLIKTFMMFAILYMYLARYPFDIWGILQYIHTILLTCSRNPNCNWLEYDRQFRVKISKIPQSTLVLLMLSYGSCISNLRFFTLHISQNPLSNVMILKVPALNTTAHSYICIHCNKYHPCIHC